MSNLSTTKAMSWPPEWEKKFIQDSALRVSRMCSVFLLAIALFELGNMLYVLWYTNFSLGTRSSRVYFHLYALLLCACFLCLLLIRLFVRREKFRHALQVQSTFVAIILWWGAAVTAYDQRVSDQIYVYLLIVISTAVLAHLRPWIAAAVFLSAQIFLMVLLPVFQAYEADNHGNYINSLAFCVMSIFICCYRYYTDRRKFYQEQLIAEKNLELQEKSRQLAYVADHDSLTGLRNRRYLREYLRELIQDAQICPQQQVGVFMIDLDNFKDFNDVFGHVKGDECLKKVAKAMDASCNSGSLFRYGGEEFLLILPSAAQADCCEAGERLRQEVESLGIPAAAQGQSVTISIGCAVGPITCEDDWDCLLRTSDRALYQAKAQGKNRFYAFEPCGSR